MRSKKHKMNVPEATVIGISILETAVCVTVSHTTTLADSSSVWAFVLTKGCERMVSPVAKYLEVEFTVQLWRGVHARQNMEGEGEGRERERERGRDEKEGEREEVRDVKKRIDSTKN
jgi:hypothetical protein